MTDPKTAEIARLAERYTPEMVALPARDDRHPLREHGRAAGRRAGPRRDGAGRLRRGEGGRDGQHPGPRGQREDRHRAGRPPRHRRRRRPRPRGRATRTRAS